MFRGDERVRGAHLHPLLIGEPPREFADDEDGFAVHDRARGGDGVAHTFQDSHGPYSQLMTFHETGVITYHTVGVECGAIASVESRVAFQHADGGLDGIEGGTPSFENSPSGGCGRPAAFTQRSRFFRRDRPGTTVHNDGKVGGRILHAMIGV